MPKNGDFPAFSAFNTCSVSSKKGWLCGLGNSLHSAVANKLTLLVLVVMLEVFPKGICKRMLEPVIHDKCGVFGIFRHSNAAELTYFGLYSLQHRGHESAGIVTAGNGEV